MSLSSTGIASGLDIQAIVSKLGALQRAPLTALQASAATTQSKISALASLRSKLNDVQEAASALRKPKATPRPCRRIWPMDGMRTSTRA